jgi:hypothetical protein
MLTNLTVTTELFHATDGTAFADIMIEGHRETRPKAPIHPEAPRGC